MFFINRARAIERERKFPSFLFHCLSPGRFEIRCILENAKCVTARDFGVCEDVDEISCLRVL